MSSSSSPSYKATSQAIPEELPCDLPDSGDNGALDIDAVLGDLDLSEPSDRQDWNLRPPVYRPTRKRLGKHRHRRACYDYMTTMILR
jgi:hypothetical protein